jgi:hypothetical protein
LAEREKKEKREKEGGDREREKKGGKTTTKCIQANAYCRKKTSR